MTDGQIHAQISYWLAFPTAALLAVAAKLLGGDPWVWFDLGLWGLVFSVVCSPDLDQAIMTNSEWAPIKAGHALLPVVGAIPGIIWTMIWLPYALYIGGAIGYRSPLLRRVLKHRGISHWPIVGTATRLAYLYGVYWGLRLLFGPKIPFSPTDLPLYESLAFVFALCVGDFGHLARDLWGIGGKSAGEDLPKKRTMAREVKSRG